MYSQKRRKQPQERRQTQREIRAQLAAVSGGASCPYSPGASTADRFRQSFDWLGRVHTGRRLDKTASAEERGAGPEPEAADYPRERPLYGAPRHSVGIPSKPLPLQRFAEVAFRRGNLFGAILQGTGKMMLVSCLRRTVMPRRPEPHDALGPQIRRRPFPGHDPDSQVFMRDLARGAVSIVVDTLHDAHRTLQMLQEAVESGAPGAEQLFTMYPFLDDSGEKRLLEEYRAGLATAADADERALLQNAVVHAGASLAEKAKMRVDFLTALRQIGDRARQAIEEFETEGFAEEVAGLAEEPAEDLPENPPGEPPEGPRRHREAEEEVEENADGTERPEPEQPDADGSREGEPGSGA